MPFIQSFRATRWLRSTNLVLQALLFVLFFGGLNYLAFNTSSRFDLTHLRRHSLSAETLAYLKQLDQPIRVIVTFPRNAAAAGSDAPADLDQINNDISGLLREYTVALEKNPRAPFHIEYIDVNQRPRDADQLGLKPDTVLFLSKKPGGEERRKVVELEELYRRKNNQRVAFLGERAFTAAILDVCNPKPPKIYFLTGHGEMDPHSVDPGRGLSELRDALKARNYNLDTVDLGHAQAVPADADIVISIGAQSRYEPYEQESLRQYMSVRAGRFMFFTAPGVAPTGLEDLLGEWGIIADDDRIYDRTENTRADFSGDLTFTTDNPHGITKVLADNHLALRFGATRSMRPDPARATDPGLTIEPLVFTSKDAWGEVSYRMPSRRVRFDPDADLPGPLAVVTVAGRVTSKSNLPFSVRVGRMAAFGCSDFVGNQRLGARANNILFFSTLNWLGGRDDDWNVPARPIERFQLALSHEQFSRLRFALLLGAPSVFALLGIIVYWTRRR